VEMIDQTVQAVSLILNTQSQTTFNLAFSFGAKTLDQAVQTDPMWERIEPRNMAIDAVQLVRTNPSARRGCLRRSLARAFWATGGPLNPRERYVVDAVMEAVLAVERVAPLQSGPLRIQSGVHSAVSCHRVHTASWFF